MYEVIICSIDYNCKMLETKYVLKHPSTLWSTMQL